MLELFIPPLFIAFTCWLLIRIVFWLIIHPVQPVNLGFFRLQGIFPSQQQKLGAALGKMVSEQFFSFDDISKKLTDPAKISAIKPYVEDHLEQFLRVKLPQTMPMISMFIGDSTINQIKTTLADELDILFPKLIGQYLENVKGELDLQQIVSSKIAALSSEKVDQALREKLGSGLAKMGWISAAFGFVMGWVLLALMFLFTI